jgi:RP/EB family microtubule-associated protein
LNSASQPATLGRHDLLRWLSDTLHLPPLKVEDCCTGAVHSQLLDSLQPGSVALHKIKWNAKFENEFIQNFKVLQEAFDKHGISRVRSILVHLQSLFQFTQSLVMLFAIQNIPVDKLAKGKYQDNFEFLQWMCQYHRTRASHNGYDALGERLKASKGRDFIAPYSLPQTVDKALSIDVEPTVFRDSSATTTTAHAIKEIPKEAPKVNTVVEETEEQKAQWQNKQTETENMISVYKSYETLIFLFSQQCGLFFMTRYFADCNLSMLIYIVVWVMCWHCAVKRTTLRSPNPSATCCSDPRRSCHRLSLRFWLPHT